MPVLLKGHSWNQDADHLTIRVPFVDNRLREDEVFTSTQLLKINKPPYYWEALLRHPIQEEDSRCSILENEVVFSLKKQDPELHWEALEQDIISKGERVRIKEKLLAEHQQRLQDKTKNRAVEKDQKKREEISRQIERDGEARTAIEKVLADSKRKELERMEKRPTEVRKDTPRPKPIQKPPQPAPKPEHIPPIRTAATVQVSFTERSFVTPKRESMEQDEREWTRKQALAKQAIGFVDEDLRPEERNPEWLKQKGDAFFQQRNYLAAVSAYSTGIRLTDRYYSLFLNRSAAHFALENYQRCAEDCSAALDLLVPPIEANRKARVHCLARRGAALVKLGFLRQGYEELVAASKLDPQNAGLRREAEMVGRKLDEDTSDSDS